MKDHEELEAEKSDTERYPNVEENVVMKDF